MSTPAYQLRLDDGFSTIIELEYLPTVKLFEKEVTPPGYNGGNPIDTTTMRNIAYRTQAPRHLKSLTKMTVTAAYATEVLPQIWQQINKNQVIMITFPDGSGLHFHGYIQEFTPSAHKEGEQPTATVTIESTMRDSNGNEVGPLYQTAEEDSLSAA
jgi:hypothetical protein